MKINKSKLKEIYLKNSLSEPLNNILGCLIKVNHKVAIGYLFNDDIENNNKGIFCLNEKEINKKFWKYFYSFEDNNYYELV